MPQIVFAKFRCLVVGTDIGIAGDADNALIDDGIHGKDVSNMHQREIFGQYIAQPASRQPDQAGNRIGYGDDAEGAFFLPV